MSKPPTNDRSILAARLAVNQFTSIHPNADVTTIRSALASALGQSFGNERDLYLALGYKKDLTSEDYDERFSRQDVADRIVRAFPEATWKSAPEVFESDDDTPTAFEAAWEDLVKRRKVFHYLRRADILAGVGRYSVLLVGLDDGLPLSEPVELSGPNQTRNVLYLQPYKESSASIATTNTDITSERYGFPEIYRLQPVEGTAVTVHHSRLIHIADNTEESDVYGVPRLKKVFNRCMDIEKIAGPSAEAFWRNVYPGLSFEMDPLVELKEEDRAALQTEVQEYVHGMNRYLMTQGVHTNQLTVQPTDPSDALAAQFQLISCQTGIPARILTGSERGELASTQDRENWADRVKERQENFAEPSILQPFVELLINVGALPLPTEWFVRWPESSTMSVKEQSEVDLNRAKTLESYVKNPAAESVVPPEVFLTRHMGYDDEQAAAALEAAGREIGRPVRDPYEEEEEPTPSSADKSQDDV